MEKQAVPGAQQHHDLAEAVAKCLTLREESQDVHMTVEAAGQVVTAVLAFFQTGLKGNRIVKSSVWSVVEAMERAFPLLLSSAVDSTRASAERLGKPADKAFLAELWAKQGLHDGSLAMLVDKIRSQPQVASAYDKAAPVRNRQQVMEFQAAILPLKGAVFELSETEQLLEAAMQDLAAAANTAAASSSTDDTQHLGQPSTSCAEASAVADLQTANPIATSDHAQHEPGRAAHQATYTPASTPAASWDAKSAAGGGWSLRTSWRNTSDLVGNMAAGGLDGLRSGVSSLAAGRYGAVAASGAETLSAWVESGNSVIHRFSHGLHPHSAKSANGKLVTLVLSVRNEADNRVPGPSQQQLVKVDLHAVQPSASRNPHQQQQQQQQELEYQPAPQSPGHEHVQAMLTVQKGWSLGSASVSLKLSVQPAADAAQGSAGAAPGWGRAPALAGLFRTQGQPDTAEVAAEPAASTSDAASAAAKAAELAAPHQAAARAGLLGKLAQPALGAVFRSTRRGKALAKASPAERKPGSAEPAKTHETDGFAEQAMERQPQAVSLPLQQQANLANCESLRSKGAAATAQPHDQQACSQPASNAPADDTSTAAPAPAAEAGTPGSKGLGALLGYLRSHSQASESVAASAPAHASGSIAAASTAGPSAADTVPETPTPACTPSTPPATVTTPPPAIQAPPLGQPSRQKALGPATEAEARQLDQAVELAAQLRQVVMGVLEEAVASPQPLDDGSANLGMLCTLVEQLLQHGLRAWPPREGWSSYLPGGKATPFGMLQAAQQSPPPAGQPKVNLGLEGPQQMAASLGDDARLRIWVRSSLNEQTLGMRLLYLFHARSVLQGWYETYAALRQDDVAGAVLGMLAGLDGLKFLLSVDALDGKQPEAVHGPGFLSAMSGMLGRRQAGGGTPQHAAAGGDSKAEKASAKKSAKSYRKVRTVAIENDGAPKRPGDVTPPDDFLSPRSSFILSPLSSVDLGGGAEPLSPNTMAFFRNQVQAVMAGAAPPELVLPEAAGSDAQPGPNSSGPMQSPFAQHGAWGSSQPWAHDVLSPPAQGDHLSQSELFLSELLSGHTSSLGVAVSAHSPPAVTKPTVPAANQHGFMLPALQHAPQAGMSTHSVLASAPGQQTAHQPAAAGRSSIHDNRATTGISASQAGNTAPARAVPSELIMLHPELGSVRPAIEAASSPAATVRTAGAAAGAVADADPSHGNMRMTDRVDNSLDETAEQNTAFEAHSRLRDTAQQSHGHGSGDSEATGLLSPQRSSAREGDFCRLLSEVQPQLRKSLGSLEIPRRSTSFGISTVAALLQTQPSRPLEGHDQQPGSVSAAADDAAGYFHDADAEEGLDVSSSHSHHELPTDMHDSSSEPAGHPARHTAGQAAQHQQQPDSQPTGVHSSDQLVHVCLREVSAADMRTGRLCMLSLHVGDSLGNPAQPEPSAEDLAADHPGTAPHGTACQPATVVDRLGVPSSQGQVVTPAPGVQRTATCPQDAVTPSAPSHSSAAPELLCSAPVTSPEAPSLRPLAPKLRVAASLRAEERTAAAGDNTTDASLATAPLAAGSMAEGAAPAQGEATQAAAPQKADPAAQRAAQVQPDVAGTEPAELATEQPLEVSYSDITAMLAGAASASDGDVDNGTQAAATALAEAKANTNAERAESMLPTSTLAWPATAQLSVPSSDFLPSISSPADPAQSGNAGPARAQPGSPGEDATQAAELAAHMAGGSGLGGWVYGLATGTASSVSGTVTSMSGYSWSPFSRSETVTPAAAAPIAAVATLLPDAATGAVQAGTSEGPREAGGAAADAVPDTAVTGKADVGSSSEVAHSAMPGPDAHMDAANLADCRDDSPPVVCSNEAAERADQVQQQQPVQPRPVSAKPRVSDAAGAATTSRATAPAAAAAGPAAATSAEAGRAAGDGEAAPAPLRAGAAGGERAPAGNTPATESGATGDAAEAVESGQPAGVSEAGTSGGNDDGDKRPKGGGIPADLGSLEAAFADSEVLAEDVGGAVAPQDVRDYLRSQGLGDVLDSDDDERDAGHLSAAASVDPLRELRVLQQVADLEEAHHGSDEHLLQDMNDILSGFAGFDDMSMGLQDYNPDISEPSTPTTSSTSVFRPDTPPDRAGLGAATRIASVHVIGAETQQDGSGKVGSEYTVYVLKVALEGGGSSWEVRRRFKDFTTLRSALKLVAGGPLPQSWSDVSKARSVTGHHRMAPEVVSARRAMLERCLQDVISSPPQLATAPALFTFLGVANPSDGNAGQPAVSGVAPADTSPDRESGAAQVGWGSSVGRMLGLRGGSAKDLAASGARSSASSPEDAMSGNRYGSMVRLLTDLPAKRTATELIRLQRGLCAACRSALPAPAKPGRFLSGSWSQSSAKGPRRCEYNGLLYCLECHHNDQEVIPARVLHNWDFGKRPVSSMAADYLGAISEQPLLCLGAVNPGLYARVPLLARTHELRARTCKALASARASSPETAAKVERLLTAAGPKRYLLESADFWAMRDLTELSKGAFSELPQWLNAAAERASALATTALLAGTHSKGSHAGKQPPRP